MRKKNQNFTSEKPLDVRWICDKHHNDWHSENGEGANAG